MWRRPCTTPGFAAPFLRLGRMTRGGRQTARGILLLAMAACFVALSFEPTSQLWAAYQDSPRWIYAVYGGASGVLAVACFVLGWRSLHQR